MKEPTKVFVVVNEDGEVENTVRVFFKVGPAKGLITTYNNNARNYPGYYKNKKLTIREGHITWKDYDPND